MLVVVAELRVLQLMLHAILRGVLAYIVTTVGIHAIRAHRPVKPTATIAWSRSWDARMGEKTMILPAYGSLR